MRTILKRIRVDEAYYLNRYPDAAYAVSTQAVPNASEHYVLRGYFENKMPYPINVDEEWYLDQYPDIRLAVEQGTYGTAQGHFDELGFQEGRLPFADFSLAG